MIADKKELIKSMQKNGVPSNLCPGIADYILYGAEPGGFLSSVLSGELFNAYMRADSTSKAAMADIVAWLWNFAPAVSIGHRKKFNSWLRNGGLMKG